MQNLVLISEVPKFILLCNTLPKYWKIIKNIAIAILDLYTFLIITLVIETYLCNSLCFSYSHLSHHHHLFPQGTMYWWLLKSQECKVSGKWTAWQSLGWGTDLKHWTAGSIAVGRGMEDALWLTHAIMAKIAQNSWWAVIMILRRKCEMSLRGALMESYLDRTESPGEDQTRWQLTVPWPFIPPSCGSMSQPSFTHIYPHLHTLSSPWLTPGDKCVYS